MRHFTYLYSRSIFALRRLYTRIRAQDISGVLAVKIISHPIVRLGSHSFSAPFCILVRSRAQYLWSVNMIFCNFDYLQASALKTSRIYKYSRSRPLEHLAVKNISHPAFRVGSHSFNVPCYILVFTMEPVDRLAVKIISHPAVRAGNHSSNVPYYVPGTCIDAELSRSFGCE